ncbi:SOS response-associated peptidase [Thiohalocapsa sp. ML1]|uniref:SOS response-associated peptidase n=1 Tax=Thiohalocapsa sp. ML1 TaxID=1431688 RepID=UPI0007323E17|nr:SOS response-associated peptidase [Thiohalocapsa sp. ML1]
MCGRFVQHADPEIYASRYAAELDPDALGDWRPSFNMAPTRPVLAIRAGKTGGRELTALRWGLIPSWSKGPDNRYSMINARAETVASKPAYRSAFRARRCVIPAEGFYEWRAPAAGAGKAKQPYFIHRRDGAHSLLAGLWEYWRPEDGAPVQSCTIIVTDANASIAPIHDRMPVVLAPAALDAWLDPGNSDAAALQALLRPAPAEDWVLRPVSPRVNNPRNDAPDLLEPIADAPPATD